MSQTPANNPPQNLGTGAGSSDNQEQEVDVTEDIEKLIAYVTKKKEDDPHDSVLSRIHSRLQDIAEKIMGDGGTTPTTPTTPQTPTISIPDLPQWTFVRKRGGRIVKRPVKKQEVSK